MQIYLTVFGFLYFFLRKYFFHFQIFWLTYDFLKIKIVVILQKIHSNFRTKNLIFCHQFQILTVAGQKTQSQNTQAQNTQCPKIPKIGKKTMLIK